MYLASSDMNVCRTFFFFSQIKATTADNSFCHKDDTSLNPKCLKKKWIKKKNRKAMIRFMTFNFCSNKSGHQPKQIISLHSTFQVAKRVCYCMWLAMFKGISSCRLYYVNNHSELAKADNQLPDLWGQQGGKLTFWWASHLLSFNPATFKTTAQCSFKGQKQL